MDYNNKKHLAVYLLAVGFVFFLFSAVLSSVFISAVPQDSDWCLEGREIEVSENGATEFKCYIFKNSFEESKYEHNLKMLKRNKNLMFVNFILSFVVTSLAFYYIPKWKGRMTGESGLEKFFTILILSWLISAAMPMVYRWVLPAPVEWFPQIFMEIHNAQVNEVLKGLR